jgi:hypothetical protein
MINYYKQLFEQNVETCEDEEFLKYAYVFFQLKDPENPALQKIRPRTIDSTECLKILAEARVEDPYKNLQNILNSDENWRLCMDFRQQRAGKTWQEYDTKEPGTISSLIEGFRYILEHREEISYDYINTLWKIATRHRKDNIDQRGHRFGCHFPETTLNFMLSFKERYGHVATLEYTPFNNFTFIPFIFMESPLTPSLRKFNDGMEEIELYYQMSQEMDDLPLYLKQFTEKTYLNAKQKQEEIANLTKNQVIEFIDQFNLVNTDTESTFGQKILAANTLVQALEITHEHLDCNARTNVTLALTKLLMDLKLPPTMFEYPMAIDGKTAEEALPLIIEAIENSKSVSHLFGMDKKIEK